MGRRRREKRQTTGGARDKRRLRGGTGRGGRGNTKMVNNTTHFRNFPHNCYLCIMWYQVARYVLRTNLCVRHSFPPPRLAHALSFRFQTSKTNSVCHPPSSPSPTPCPPPFSLALPKPLHQKRTTANVSRSSYTNRTTPTAESHRTASQTNPPLPRHHKQNTPSPQTHT